jgi:hypothetical protein
MAPTTFKLEGEVTSLSESSQGEVGDNTEKWGDFWEKSIAINQNIVEHLPTVRSFKYAAAVLWNDLPDDFRKIPILISLRIF